MTFQEMNILYEKIGSKRKAHYGQNEMEALIFFVQDIKEYIDLQIEEKIKNVKKEYKKDELEK